MTTKARRLELAKQSLRKALSYDYAFYPVVAWPSLRVVMNRGQEFPEIIQEFFARMLESGNLSKSADGNTELTSSQDSRFVPIVDCSQLYFVPRSLALEYQQAFAGQDASLKTIQHGKYAVPQHPSPEQWLHMRLKMFGDNYFISHREYERHRQTFRHIFDQLVRKGTLVDRDEVDRLKGLFSVCYQQNLDAPTGRQYINPCNHLFANYEDARAFAESYPVSVAWRDDFTRRHSAKPVRANMRVLEHLTNRTARIV